MAASNEPTSDLLPLCLGATGNAVRDVQIRLRRSGCLTGSEPTGTFDQTTLRAIIVFQDRAGLEATGTCDHPTWSALVEAGYTLGDRLLYHRVPMLRGDDVATLQRRLSELGFHSGRVDGIFGPETESAVRSFQRNSALVTDGVAGPDVVTQLHRLGPGNAPGTSTVTKATLADRLQLLDTPHDVSGARIAIAESGTLPALIKNIAGRLDAAGAHTLAIHHPDGSASAAEANRFEAHCFIGCTARTDPGARLSFYRTEGFESTGGRHLAHLVRTHLTAAGLPGSIDIHGMRLPVLRETRMPALWCEVGPPTWVVEHGPNLASCLTTAMIEWVTGPFDILDES